jgi:FkbM family methyltransferase
MLTKLAGHSVDLSSLPAQPVVLDGGARNFGFSLAILGVRPQARIIAIDPDPSITPDKVPAGVKFIQEALVGNSRQRAKFALQETEEGRFIYDGLPSEYHFRYGLRASDKILLVLCTRIIDLMDRLDIKFWDLVKLDIEDSEFEVLENWPGRIAGQISVEFHDWMDQTKWNPQYYQRLLAGPLKGYEWVQHELMLPGCGTELGHWNSLLKLSKEQR